MSMVSYACFERCAKIRILAETGFCGIKNPDYHNDGRDPFYVANCLFGDFGFNGKDGNKGFAFSLLLEFDDTITQCIQSVIFAHSDVLAGIVLRAALTNDDIASDSGLSTEKFHSESLTS